MSDEEDEDLEEGWSIQGPRIGVRPLAAPLTSAELVEWDKENKQREKKMLEKNIRLYGGLRAPRELGKRGAPMSDENRDLPDSYIGIKEAAGLVAKSTDSIRRAIRSGKLKAEMAPDGRYLIDEADVLKAFPQRPDGIKGTPAYVLELVALQTELVEARAALETSQAQIETKQARIDELEADKAQLSRAFEVISDTLASQNRRGRPLMLEAEPRKRRLWRRGGN